jgi:hypothetical protein
MSVASIAHSSTWGETYAAFGTTLQHAGGVQLSDDGAGATWSIISSDEPFYFSAQGPNEGDPFTDTETEVRSTGNLIVLDETNNFVYAGTYEDGVWRYSRSTGQWSQIALSDGSAHCSNVGYSTCHIRTLVPDPSSDTTLFVGTYGNGAYRITNAHLTPSVNHIGSSPDFVEEIAFDTSDANRLYCACGKDGMRTAPSTDYTSWTTINDETNGPEWVAVAAGGGHVYAGAHNPAASASGYKSIKPMVSGDSTFNWSNLTSNATIDPETCGTATDWWLKDAESGAFLLGGVKHDVSMIATSGTQEVYVSGRSGVWRSLDDGEIWCPAVKGLGLTAPKDIGTSSTSGDEDRVYIGSTDWTFFRSEDNGATVTQKGVTGATYGFAVAVDIDSGSTSDVYLGVGTGKQSDHLGEVYSSDDRERAMGIHGAERRNGRARLPVGRGRGAAHWPCCWKGGDRYDRGRRRFGVWLVATRQRDRGVGTGGRAK